MRIPAKVGGVGVTAIVDSRAQVNLLTTAAAERMVLEVPRKTESLGAAFGSPIRVGVLRKVPVECSSEWKSEETFRMADRNVPEVALDRRHKARSPMDYHPISSQPGETQSYLGDV
mmetsp:Transcript_27686/g.108575  ORF Transcript_27686/g.108575 Transcript_27686/m.108575 type:complete len:116 (+) Transcript_27686:146-493(+)